VLLAVEGTYSILHVERREAIIVAHPSGRMQAPKSGLMEDVLASIPEAVAIVHGNHVLYTNPAFTNMFGYTSEEAGGGNLRELIVPETRSTNWRCWKNKWIRRARVSADTVRMNKARRTGRCGHGGGAVARGWRERGLRAELPRHWRAPATGKPSCGTMRCSTCIPGWPIAPCFLTG